MFKTLKTILSGQAVTGVAARFTVPFNSYNFLFNSLTLFY